MQFEPLPPRTSGTIFLETFLCLVILVASLVGNILVCLSVYRNRTLLRASTNLYIIALAVADLISALVVMPFTAAVLISGGWYSGSFLCNLHAFTMNFVLFVSPVTMALTAFNRYIRIVKPNRYNTIFTKKRSLAMLGCAWALVTCYVAIPKLAGLYDYGFIPKYAVCHVTHLYDVVVYVHYSVVVTLFLISPLAIATVCYLKVSKTIRLHSLDVATNLRASYDHSQRNISVQEIKISKSLFVVVFGFILCWIPAWAVAIMFRFQLVTSIPRGFQLFCSLSIFMSSAVNPFIYAGMNRSFRQEFKKIIKCRSEVIPAPPVLLNRIT